MKYEELPEIKYPMIGGYVYIIETPENIKIGRSKNIKQRINAIKTTSGKKILNIFISPACRNYCEIENAMHKEFSDRRCIGEWFKVSFMEAVKQLEEFTFLQIEKAEENTEKIVKPFGIDVMKYLQKREPVIYEYLKENNYYAYYDEKLKEVFVKENNEDYLEIPLKTFIEMQISFLRQK